MKKMIYFFAIFSVLSISFFADETKVYLKSASIKVVPEGIFLEFDDKLLPIETVSKDKQGIFIVTNEEQAYILYCAACGLTFDLERQSPYCPHPATN